MKRIIIFIILVGFLSCERSIDKSDSIKKEEALIFKNEIQHKFSDDTNPDNFSLTLTGDSIISGKIFFQISNKKNNILYRDSFAASDLLYDPYETIPTVKMREDTILTRFKRFFRNNNFIKPSNSIGKSFGVTNSEELNQSEPEVWNEITSDSTSVGFLYSYGYEGSTAIAYSKRQKKIVVYFTCD